MNKYLSSTAICLMLTMTTLYTYAAEKPIEELKTEVRERELAFAQSMEARNFDAFLSFISTEAIFFNGNQPLIGIEAISQSWAAFFEAEQAPFSWQPDLIEVLESGTLAISSGPVFGASGEAAGRFNSIWRKEPDGQWRVVFDKGS